MWIKVTSATGQLLPTDCLTSTKMKAWTTVSPQHSTSSQHCTLQILCNDLLKIWSAKLHLKSFVRLLGATFLKNTCTRRWWDLFRVIEDHAGRVIDSNHHLVLAFTRLDSTQPKLVLPEVAGYVLNHATHARSLAGAKATSDTHVTTCYSC